MKRVTTKTWILLLGMMMLSGAAISLQWKERLHSARATVQQEDQLVLRQAIKEFSEDKGKTPETLEDLVDAGYLKSIPEVSDPPLPHRNVSNP